jgi:hypothetical protein
MKTQSPSTTPAHDYLIEMTFAPFATLPTPEEAAAFAENLALPSIEALEKLLAEGRIVAGGTNLAAAGFTFIARASSPLELEEMIGRLPLSVRALTRVVPLGTFGSRAATIRARLARSRSAAATPGRS